MKVAVSIPDELFDSAEALTKRLGVSRLNAVYESEDSRLPLAVRRLQGRSLTREP